jgi:hypothetical protein
MTSTVEGDASREGTYRDVYSVGRSRRLGARFKMKRMSQSRCSQRSIDYIQSRSLGAPAGGSFAGPYVSDFERAAGLDADQLIGRSDGYRDYSHPREPNYVGCISHPAVFPDYLRLHLVGIDIEMLGQVNAEAQAIEEGAGA